ncbi:hypothetical protein [Serratia marcescens]|uniref:hypothetical protein n=1 Tax=Serratia marcescens TaxID=615 RepID=UPI00141D1078|nr:hypothetical protein [Serratia marcescens]CAB1228942.1 hypothetical protein FB6_5002 [Serratia marcescens]
MSWGALFVDNDGVPWATPDSTPISLVKKYRIARAGAGNDQLDVDFTKPVVLAMVANTNGVIASVSRSASGGASVTSKLIIGNGPYAIDVYAFSTQFQPAVKFGINIFDAQGRCIQTNETKVMPAPRRLGEPGSDGAGYNVRETLAGRWAIIPATTGYITAVIGHQQPRPFQQPISSFSAFDGSNTSVYSGAWDTPGGEAHNITYYNTKDSVYVIDVSGF